MFLFKPTPVVPLYKDSEEYLKKQQQIDTLLVLTKFFEPGVELPDQDLRKTAGKISAKILDEFNK